LSDFDRPLTEKLTSDPFSDPASASLSCVQSGPVKIGNIDKSRGGEEVFEESKNLFFKQIKVKRVLDPDTNTLIYVSFSTRLDKSGDENKSRFKSSLCSVHVDNI
jgi:catabolite regulation protein CreA